MSESKTSLNIIMKEDLEIVQTTNKQADNPDDATITDCDDTVPETDDDCYNRQNCGAYEEVEHTNNICPKSCTPTKDILPNHTLRNDISQQKCPQTAKCSHSSGCTLESILREIGLYNELYNLFNDCGFDCESLTYIKGKHIDELFKNMSLNLKIIFEHRIMEWQKKHKIIFEESVSLEISQSTCGKKENCQLLSIKDSDGTSTNYHISETKNLIKMPNIKNEQNYKSTYKISNGDGHKTRTTLDEADDRLMGVIKSALDATLQEYTTLPEHDVVKNIKDSSPNNKPDTGLVAQGERFVNIDLGGAFSETGLQGSRELSTKNDNDQTGRLKIIKPSNQVVNNHKLEPSVLYNRKRKWGLETEVKAVLMMYKSGNILLEACQGFEELTPGMRTELVHILVDHFVINHEFISVPQCRKLAEDITALFPMECLETYFFQETRNCTPKGKLWDRYQNQRQRQKKSFNALLNPQNIVYTRLDQPEMELLCSQLKLLDDEKRLLRKWHKTFHFRRYQLQSEYFENWKLYFDEYPFCKQPNYSQFIDADLDMLYPNLKFDEDLWDEFLNNFKLFYWNRITHIKSRHLFEELISTDDNITEKSDYFEIKIIELLHAALNSTPQIVEEAQRQFTVEVPDLGELKKVVIERKKFCVDNGIQCKPFIAVVGQNRSYEHYSVVLDSTGFSCDSYQESVILCFKLYLFFDLCYSAETLNTWLFIQKYFFNKHSILKNEIVDAFILDVRSQKEVNLRYN